MIQNRIRLCPLVLRYIKRHIFIHFQKNNHLNDLLLSFFTPFRQVFVFFVDWHSNSCVCAYDRYVKVKMLIFDVKQKIFGLFLFYPIRNLFDTWIDYLVMIFSRMMIKCLHKINGGGWFILIACVAWFISLLGNWFIYSGDFPSIEVYLD